MTGQAKSSFHLAMRFLPPGRKQALQAVYDFCRAADDAADESPDEETARRLLAGFRDQIERIYAGPGDYLYDCVQAPRGLRSRLVASRRIELLRAGSEAGDCVQAPRGLRSRLVASRREELLRAGSEAGDCVQAPRRLRSRLVASRREGLLQPDSPQDRGILRLADAIYGYRLERSSFHSMLDGLMMDVGGRMVRPDLATLALYCYRVAGCVGQLAGTIMTGGGEATDAFATALGHALQLTNILRDVREDADRGRLYLPQEWLDAEGIGDVTPQTLSRHPVEVERVCLRVAERATDYFAEAEALSRHCNRRRLLPALLMRDVYVVYLHDMLRVGSFLFATRKKLHFGRKLRIAAGMVRYWRRNPEPVHDLAMP